MTYTLVSVDLGQTTDPTAIAVLKVRTRTDAVAEQYTDPPGDLARLVTLDWWTTDRTGQLIAPDRPLAIDVGILRRLPLGMPYPAQVDEIARTVARARPERLLVDQTGVGRPVVDLLRRAGLYPTGVTITAGDKEVEGYSDQGFPEWRVAKLLLVSHLQALLNQRILRIGRSLPEARAFVEELGDFRAHITETGYTRFGAREGAHDDLVLAVAIGAWWANRRYGSEVSTWNTVTGEEVR